MNLLFISLRCYFCPYKCSISAGFLLTFHHVKERTKHKQESKQKESTFRKVNRILNYKELISTTPTILYVFLCLYFFNKEYFVTFKEFQRIDPMLDFSLHTKL